MWALIGEVRATLKYGVFGVLDISSTISFMDSYGETERITLFLGYRAG